MKRTVFLFLLAGILLFTGCRGREEMPLAAGKSWSVGYGAEVIIPDGYEEESNQFTQTYYLAGYQTDKRAMGVLDHQYVRAVYLSDGTGNEIILAAIDCVGVSRKNLERIKRRLRDLEVDAIHIMSTHTHAGIDTLGIWGPPGIDGKDEGFMNRMYDAAETAIRTAYQTAKTGKLYYGFADTGNLQEDSRAPYIYDRNIYRLRFVPDDGGSGVSLISYDAHPEALRSSNFQVSADFPRYMGEEIKKSTGDDTIFFAGAVGGLIATRLVAPLHEANVTETGRYLAECVLSISNEKELVPSVLSQTETVRVRLDNTLYRALIFAGVLDVDVVPDLGLITGQIKADTEVSLVTLGGLEGISIALVPGELFPELRPEEDNVLIYGLANDEIGYLVAPDNYHLHEDAPYIKRYVDETGEDYYEETNSIGPDSSIIAEHIDALILERDQKFEKYADMEKR